MPRLNFRVQWKRLSSAALLASVGAAFSVAVFIGALILAGWGFGVGLRMAGVGG